MSLTIYVSSGKVQDGLPLYNQIEMDPSYRAETPPYMSAEYRFLCEFLCRLEVAQSDNSAVFLLLPPAVPVIAGEPCVPLTPTAHNQNWTS